VRTSRERNDFVTVGESPLPPSDESSTLAAMFCAAATAITVIDVIAAARKRVR